jgi:hypothetical protein
LLFAVIIFWHAAVAVETRLACTRGGRRRRGDFSPAFTPSPHPSPEGRPRVGGRVARGAKQSATSQILCLRAPRQPAISNEALVPIASPVLAPAQPALRAAALSQSFRQPQFRLRQQWASRTSSSSPIRRTTTTRRRIMECGRRWLVYWQVRSSRSCFWREGKNDRSRRRPRATPKMMMLVRHCSERVRACCPGRPIRMTSRKVVLSLPLSTML